MRSQEAKEAKETSRVLEHKVQGKNEMLETRKNRRRAEKDVMIPTRKTRRCTAKGATRETRKTRRCAAKDAMRETRKTRRAEKGVMMETKAREGGACRETR